MFVQNCLTTYNLPTIMTPVMPEGQMPPYDAAKANGLEWKCGVASGRSLHAVEKRGVTYSVWQIALMKHQQLVGVVNQSCVCCLKAILHTNSNVSVHSETSLPQQQIGKTCNPICCALI